MNNNITKPSTKATGEPSGTVIEMTSIISIYTAITYLLGWTYASTWFDSFNVGMIGLNLSLEYVLNYGFWVIKNQWECALILLTSPILGYYIWRRYIRQKLSDIAIVLLPTAMLCLFIATYEVGQIAADSQLEVEQATYNSLPYVKVLLNQKDPENEKTIKLSEQLQSREYKLLLQTKDHIYLFKPTTQAKPATIVIPFSQIKSMKILG